MAVFGILKKALPLAALGLGIFALANIITKPQQASQTGGSVRLIDPLFSLKDLFGVQSTADPTAAIESERTQSNTSIQDPVANTAGPNLSPASQTIVFNPNLAGGGFSASSFFGA